MTTVNLFSIKLYNNDNKFVDRADIKLMIKALFFICIAETLYLWYIKK